VYSPTPLVYSPNAEGHGGPAYKAVPHLRPNLTIMCDHPLSSVPVACDGVGRRASGLRCAALPLRPSAVQVYHPGVWGERAAGPQEQEQDGGI